MKVVKKISKKRMLPRHVKIKITALKRKRYHLIQHTVHKKYRLAKKTVFYMKEYGPRSHVTHVIVKESILILIIASILSSIGGIYLQNIQQNLAAIIPLLILIPALTDMIGDYGTIVSAKFTTMLYLGRIREGKYLRSPLGALFGSIIAIGIIAAVYVSMLSATLAYLKGFALTFSLVIRLVEIAMISTLSLIALIFLISMITGFWLYKRGEDPNNWLVPLTTSAADFGALLIFSTLVTVMF